MTYNSQGKRTSVENLAGQVTTTAWDGWSVTYNGENRPVLWQCVSTNSPTSNSSTPTLLSMSFDRMGRRVTKNNQRFVYNGYLQIANFELQTSNIKLHTFIWDPTEPVATRPLAWLVLSSLGEGGYYTHDGNKNVSEVIAADGDVCAHYEYAPFGAVAVQPGKSASTNPWRFSSEFADDATKTIYYIFRCHEPLEGRWLSRDPIEEHGGQNLFENVGNDPIGRVDRRGLYGNRCSRIVGSIMDNKNGGYAKYKKYLMQGLDLCLKRARILLLVLLRSFVIVAGA